MIKLTPAMLDAASEAYDAADPHSRALEAALDAALALADRPAPRGAYGERKVLAFYQTYSAGRLGSGHNYVTIPAGESITNDSVLNWEGQIRKAYGFDQVVVTGWQALEG